MDQSGGISSYDSRGEFRWRYEPPESQSPVAGPTVVSSGDIYYPIGGSVQALTAEGDPRWIVRGFPYELRINPIQQIVDGQTLIWEDLVLDAESGEQLQLEIVPGLRHSQLITAMGQSFALSGEGGVLSAVEWQRSGSGPQLLGSVTWNMGDISASLPTDAGITADGEAWFYYGRTYLGSRRPSIRLVWGDLQGRILTVSTPALVSPSFAIGVDAESKLYLCGVGDNSTAECQAYSSSSDLPLWEVSLGTGVIPVGGAIAEGRLYVSSEQGTLFVIENVDELSEAALATSS